MKCFYCGAVANVVHSFVGGMAACPGCLENMPKPVCIECSSAIPSGRKGNFCSESCETANDRAAYEEGL